MADAVLKFPGGKPDKSAKAIPFEGSNPPKLDSFSYDETVDLYQIATSVKKRAEDLVTFVDQNRQIARQAGMEILAVQLNSTLEGERFQRIIDALEDAVYRRVPVSLTRDGTDKVHRMERLIADADTAISNFMSGRKIDPVMGQVALPLMGQHPVIAHAPSSDIGTWLPVVIIGVAGIVGVIAIIALNRNQPQPVPVGPPHPASPPLAGKSKSRRP